MKVANVLKNYADLRYRNSIGGREYNFQDKLLLYYRFKNKETTVYNLGNKSDTNPARFETMSSGSINLGSPPFATFAPELSSVEFTSTLFENYRIHHPNLDLSNNRKFTICTWIKHPTLGYNIESASGYSKQPILFKIKASDSLSAGEIDFEFYFSGDSTAGRVIFTAYDGDVGSDPGAYRSIYSNKFYGSSSPLITPYENLSNKWIHLAVTWDGTGTSPKIYINGIDNTATTTSGGGSFVSIRDCNADILVGKGTVYGDTNSPYNSNFATYDIAEFSIFEGELNAEQIKLIYDLQVNGIDPNRFRSGILTNPSKIILQERDNNTIAYPTIATSGDSRTMGVKKIHFDDSFTRNFSSPVPEYRYNLNKSFGSRIKGSDYNATGSLMAWYPLQEVPVGNKFIELRNRADIVKNHSTAFKSPDKINGRFMPQGLVSFGGGGSPARRWVQGRVPRISTSGINYSPSFSGPKHVRFPILSNFGIVNTDFSVQAWFKYREYANTETIVMVMHLGDAAGDNRLLIDYRRDTGKFRVYTKGGSGTRILEWTVTEEEMSENWNHIVVTHTESSKSIKAYWNGRFKKETTNDLLMTSTDLIVLGADNDWIDDLVQNNFWTGQIIHFAIWKTALDDKNISALYEARNGIYSQRINVQWPTMTPIQEHGQPSNFSEAKIASCSLATPNILPTLTGSGYAPSYIYGEYPYLSASTVDFNDSLTPFDDTRYGVSSLEEDGSLPEFYAKGTPAPGLSGPLSSKTCIEIDLSTVQEKGLIINPGRSQLSGVTSARAQLWPYFYNQIPDGSSFDVTDVSITGPSTGNTITFTFTNSRAWDTAPGALLKTDSSNYKIGTLNADSALKYATAMANSVASAKQLDGFAVSSVEDSSQCVLTQDVPGALGNSVITFSTDLVGKIICTAHNAPVVYNTVYIADWIAGNYPKVLGFTLGLNGRTNKSGDFANLASDEPGWSYRSTYPMYYYNFNKKQYEGIGQGKSFSHAVNKWKTTDDAGLPVYTRKQVSEQAHTLLQDLCIGFNGNQSYTQWQSRRINEILENDFAGTPISTYGFPFHPKFHATGSQVSKVSTLVDRPFLVEKIVFDVSCSLKMPFNSFQPLMTATWFLLNQRANYHISSEEGEVIQSGSTSNAMDYWNARVGGTAEKYNFNPILSCSIPQRIKLTDSDKLTLVSDSRDLVTWGTVTAVSGTTAGNSTWGGNGFFSNQPNPSDMMSWCENNIFNRFDKFIYDPRFLFPPGDDNNWGVGALQPTSEKYGNPFPDMRYDGRVSYQTASFIDPTGIPPVGPTRVPMWNGFGSRTLVFSQSVSSPVKLNYSKFNDRQTAPGGVLSKYPGAHQFCISGSKSYQQYFTDVIFLPDWNHGTRSGLPTPTGRDFLGGFHAGKENPPLNPKVKKENPYIIMPGDELIFGWQAPFNNNMGQIYYDFTLPAPSTTSGFVSKIGDVDSFLGQRTVYDPFSYSPNPYRFEAYFPGFLQIHSGSSKLKIYGSYLSNHEAVEPILNQELTTVPVHEVVGGRAVVYDQWEISLNNIYSGSTKGDVFFGKLTNPESGPPNPPGPGQRVSDVRRGVLFNGKKLQINHNQTRHAMLNVIRGDAADLGSLQRTTRLSCPEETLLDSWVPDPIAMFAKDKYEFEGGVPVDLLGRVEGPALTLGSVLDSAYSSTNIFRTNRKWMRSFPFEPRYRYSTDGSEISRIDSINNVGYVRYNISADILGAARPLTARYGNKIPRDLFVDRFGVTGIYGDEGSSFFSERSKSMTLWCFGDHVSGSLGKRRKYSSHTFTPTDDIEIITYKPRGLKYGLAGHKISNSSAVYRSNRYGQFRDMLEQRQFTAFNLDRDGQITPGAKPVVCSFRVASFLEPGTVGNVIDPELTDSSNLSIFCTSSIPYFEDYRLYPLGRNRATPVPEQQVEIVEVN